MSVTLGSPLVMVPVLSKAMICILPVCSKDWEVLKRMPFLAAMPLPTMMATGVARPKAHGQEMTRTEIPLSKAVAKRTPAKSQPMVVRRAIAMTVGTKMPETLSAILAIGALVAAASETILMIWESVVSSPTLVAWQRR